MCATAMGFFLFDWTLNATIIATATSKPIDAKIAAHNMCKERDRDSERQRETEKEIDWNTFQLEKCFMCLLFTGCFSHSCIPKAFSSIWQIEHTKKIMQRKRKTGTYAFTLIEQKVIGLDWIGLVFVAISKNSHIFSGVWICQQIEMFNI